MRGILSFLTATRNLVRSEGRTTSIDPKAILNEAASAHLCMGLESNIIYNMDCLEGMKLMSDGSVDMILCDLPYGTTACAWDTVIPFNALWESYSRIVKPNGAVILSGNEPFSSALRLSNLSQFRYDWYWQKDKGANFLFGNRMPLKTIEVLSVFYGKQPTYNPQKEVNPRGATKRHLSRNPSKISRNVRDVMGAWKPTEMDASENYHGKNYEPDKLLPKQLVYFAREQRGKIHPTQKPVALFEYIVRTYTSPGELVLDNCIGSGTTAIACINSGRDFIGFENDSAHYEAAVKRIAVHQKSLLGQTT